MYLTCVATDAIIFLEADNLAIGLMSALPVGMAEVGTCDITVKEGQRAKQGDELGISHYGGSTFCLLFRKSVELVWEIHGQEMALGYMRKISWLINELQDYSLGRRESNGRGKSC